MQAASRDRSSKPPVGAYHPKILQIGMGTRLYEREVNTTSPRKVLNKTSDTAKREESFGFLRNSGNLKDSSPSSNQHTKNRQKLNLLLGNSVPDYKTKSIRSPINFDVQLLRRQNINQSYDLEGKRFIVKRDPENWSKIRKLRNVEMQK